ncbi:MAG: hypothetical protein OCC49_18020 [Fibrobacterales bacterium]
MTYESSHENHGSIIRQLEDSHIKAITTMQGDTTLYLKLQKLSDETP